jgi:hypothetical protein
MPAFPKKNGFPSGATLKIINLGCRVEGFMGLGLGFKDEG